MDEKVAKLLETLGKGSRVEGIDEAVQIQKELEEKVGGLLLNMMKGGRGRDRTGSEGGSG